MPSCPRCHQPIEAQAVNCPYCRTPLKAYGHPGIPLHRAVGKEYLCQSCTYHADDTCTFPQRPFAKECTLYVDVSHSQLEVRPSTISSWVKQHQALFMLLSLLFIAFLFALRSSPQTANPTQSPGELRTTN